MFVTSTSIAASSPFLLASVIILGLVAYVLTTTKVRHNLDTASEILFLTGVFVENQNPPECEPAARKDPSPGPLDPATAWL